LQSVNLYGNGLLGYIDKTSSNRFYYIKDHLGSIRQVIDENGNIAAARDYYPYGGILREHNSSLTNDRYKFTEKERDNETSFDYFGARYYDSGIGRWTTVDPLADKYPGWSPYAYTFNNPLRFIDFDGLEIRIYTGDKDDDGNEIYMTYTAGMEYNGNNSFGNYCIK